MAIRELYEPNLNYGAATILRRYSGFEGPAYSVGQPIDGSTTRACFPGK